jgi:hypothetical protein
MEMELPAGLSSLARGRRVSYRFDMCSTHGLAPASAKTPGRSSFPIR